MSLTNISLSITSLCVYYCVHNMMFRCFYSIMKSVYHQSLTSILAPIQEALRRRCGGCTILAIAHRLNTILDYDSVVVRLCIVHSLACMFGILDSFLACALASIFAQLASSSNIHACGRMNNFNEQVSFLTASITHFWLYRWQVVSALEYSHTDGPRKCDSLLFWSD